MPGKCIGKQILSCWLYSALSMWHGYKPKCFTHSEQLDAENTVRYIRISPFVYKKPEVENHLLMCKNFPDKPWAKQCVFCDQWSPATPCVEGSGHEARQEEPVKFFFLVRSDSESQLPYQRESLKHKPEVPMLDTKASQISIKASSHRNGQSMDCECSWMSKTVPFSNWKRKWQPTPVFFPGKPCSQRNVVGYRPRACNEVDMTEQLTLAPVSDHSIWRLCSFWYSHSLKLPAIFGWSGFTLLLSNISLVPRRVQDIEWALKNIF